MPNSTRSGQAPEGDYTSDYPANAEYSSYIPVQSLSEGDLITYPNGSKVFLYSMTIPVNNISGSKKFENFSKAFANSFYWHKLDHRNITKTYIVNKGILMNVVEFPFKATPMMVLCVKRDSLYKLDKHILNPKDFCLVINREFIEDEEHFKLYRNVKKYYIDDVEDEIDILYTRDIIQTCYNLGPIELPKFKTIAEMINHTNSINELVRASFSDTHNV